MRYDFVSDIILVCQRPERAYFISTNKNDYRRLKEEAECQRPERAYFISTL